MFSNAGVGDRVWSFELGWGTILYDQEPEPYNLIVSFDNGVADSFTTSGRRSQKGRQVLFWDEIKYEIPEKPKKQYFRVVMMGKEDNVYVLDTNYTNKEDAEKVYKNLKGAIGVAEIWI